VSMENDEIIGMIVFILGLFGASSYLYFKFIFKNKQLNQTVKNKGNENKTIQAGKDVTQDNSKNKGTTIFNQCTFINRDANEELVKKTNKIEQNENELDIPEWEKKVIDWENQYGVKFQAQVDKACNETSAAFLVKAIEYDFLVKHLYINKIISNHDSLTIGLLTELEVQMGITNFVPCLYEFYNRLLENDELYKWICLTPQEKRNRLKYIVNQVSISTKKRLEYENRKCKEYISNNPQILEIFREKSSLQKFIALNNYYEPIIIENVPNIYEFIQNSKVKYRLLYEFYKILDCGPNVLKEFLNMPYNKQEQDLKGLEDKIKQLN